MEFRKHGLLVAIALGALLTTGLVACGGDDDDGGDSTATAAGKTGAATTASGDNGGATEEITIVMTDNVFTPKDITVPVGKEVKIEVKNEGAAVHNMHVLSEKAEGKDFSSEALVQPGKDDSFTVKFSKAGKYDFQCDYHVPDMVGTITAK
ncbi:MAG: cupredoxin domain-containing protein [Dehalococcoidia bacterium]|nr:cupredoxin domain-containing protein [Dehalococcoidia bacterium]MCB9484568.1 cupredoxin domain-containing protein [Thermoflexaceae bacterium]